MIDIQTLYVVSVAAAGLVHDLVLMRIVFYIIDRLVPRGETKDQ